jgi:beta-N-acetylhexosaminidase
VKIRIRLDADGWAGAEARRRYAKSMRVGRVLLTSIAAALLVNFVTTAATPVKAPAKKLLKAPPPQLSPDMRAAQAMARRMSLADQAAQLVIVVCNGDAYSLKSPEYERYRHLVRDVHIGGLIVNNAVQYGLVRYAEPHALAVFLNQMQRLAKTPLIVGSDFERAASMRVSGGARFPYNMAFGASGDIDAVRYEGLVAAHEARAVGIHWIFAPVADVNNNPDNPIINIRSYGEDPEQVSRFVAAFIDGAHSDPENRVLTAAKHFPGHGDVAVDSHLDLPRLDVSRERLDSIELKPFQEAIAHGVDSIMTAHMSVPALDPEDVPATVSPRVLKDLLRDELKFSGLIVTDAMDMQGLAKQFSGGEAAVRAVAAGVDVLLMPPDPDRAVNALVAAVKGGQLSRQRVEESATRVLAAKIRLGLMKKKLVDLDAITTVLDSPESTRRAQEVSDRAVTLLKNNARPEQDGGNGPETGIIPLDRAGKLCMVVLREVRVSTTGLRLAQEVQARAPGTSLVVVDSSMPLASLEAAVGDTAMCAAMIVETSATPSANRGNVALGGQLGSFVERLTERAPVALVSLGNPYLLASFPKAAAYLATFSSTVPSEISAAKALFGEIAITGHTPVTIPGFAMLGDGIQIPARPR